MVMLKRRKHKIFRHHAWWFARCADCPELLLATCWSGALGLLTLHVDEHRPLTTAGS